MVSIVVPVYNAENYLKKCVDSLINQTYKDIEIILVNDGSTDDSLKICNEYNNLDKRVRVIDKENGGASSARNAGIRVATGDYIMFADSDDYADENWVNEVVDAQEKNKDAFVFCDICGVLSNKEVVKLHGKQIESGYYKLKDYYLFSINNVLNQPVNKIFVNRIIKENSIYFDESLQIGEDLVFNLEYIKHCDEIYFIDKVLYYCLTNRLDSLCHCYYSDLFETNMTMYKKHLELFDYLSIDDNLLLELKLSFVGSVTDCLDRELNQKQKSFSERKKRMKTIMSNSDYLEALNQVKTNINSRRFRVLSSKSPLFYIAYYKMSKMR